MQGSFCLYTNMAQHLLYVSGFHAAAAAVTSIMAVERLRQYATIMNLQT